MPLHPNFDLNAWIAMIPIHELNTEEGTLRVLHSLHSKFYLQHTPSEMEAIQRDLDVFCGAIESPVTAALSIQLRDKFAKEFELEFERETDVVVWKSGEGKDSRQTRLGGRPVWPKGRPWPKSPSGKPMKFLFQFCFSDSHDLLPILPGDLLVIMSENGDDSIFDAEGNDPENPDIITFEEGFAWQAYWLSLGEDLETVENKLARVIKHPLHASIFRTGDAPGFNPNEKQTSAQIRLFESREYSDFGLYSSFPIQGTKIGGIPAYMQDEYPPQGGIFLGALWSYTLSPSFPDVPRTNLYDEAFSLYLGGNGHLNLFWLPDPNNSEGRVIGQWTCT